MQRYESWLGENSNAAAVGENHWLPNGKGKTRTGIAIEKSPPYLFQPQDTREREGRKEKRGQGRRTSRNGTSYICVCVKEDEIFIWTKQVFLFVALRL